MAADCECRLRATVTRKMDRLPGRSRLNDSMTELDIRMEVGNPTDDTMELEGEEPTEVRLWPLHFYRNDEAEPLLSVEVAIEQEEDEDGFFPAYTIAALEDEFEERLAAVLTLSEVDAAGEEVPDWIDEEDLKVIQELSDEEQELYGMVADLLDYAQAALEEQSIEPGTVVRHSELLEEMEGDEDEDEDEA